MSCGAGRAHRTRLVPMSGEQPAHAAIGVPSQITSQDSPPRGSPPVPFSFMLTQLCGFEPIKGGASYHGPPRPPDLDVRIVRIMRLRGVVTRGRHAPMGECATSFLAIWFCGTFCGMEFFAREKGGSVVFFFRCEKFYLFCFACSWLVDWVRLNDGYDARDVLF